MSGHVCWRRVLRALKRSRPTWAVGAAGLRRVSAASWARAAARISESLEELAAACTQVSAQLQSASVTLLLRPH